MTVEVCSRVGVRVSAAPGAIKDESQPGGGTSPAHETSEAPTPRPKFMITDILAQHKPPTSTQSEGSAPPTSTIEEPKDLSLTRTHAEDDDIDLEGDASHDEDDHGESGEPSRASVFRHCVSPLPLLSSPLSSHPLPHLLSLSFATTSRRRHPSVPSLAPPSVCDSASQRHSSGAPHSWKVTRR